MVGSELISNAAAHPWNIRGHDSLSRHNVDELMISPAKRQAEYPVHESGQIPRNHSEPHLVKKKVRVV